MKITLTGIFAPAIPRTKLIQTAIKKIYRKEGKEKNMMRENDNKAFANREV